MGKNLKGIPVDALYIACYLEEEEILRGTLQISQKSPQSLRKG
jgi:hypothetical protein